MKIIILGAGDVGLTLAHHLNEEHNEITLVDKDIKKLNEIQSYFDLKTIVGHCTHPTILRQAGIENVDMLLAVTNEDESNMLACQMAYSLFKTPLKIARIRSSQYTNHPEIFNDSAIPVDVAFSPESLVTESIHNIINYPGSSQVLSFEEGRLLLISVIIKKKSPLNTAFFSDLVHQTNDIEIKYLAIFRGNKRLPLKEDTQFEPGDELIFITQKENVQRVLLKCYPHTKPCKNIIIAGAGEIGMGLAQRLEDDYHVKIIDHNKQHCLYTSNHLNNTTVLNGETNDANLLINENIENTDLYCALTNKDEVNILSSLLAKNLGAKKVLALVNNKEYFPIINDSNIDVGLSPQGTTISKLLRYLRKGHILEVHSLNHNSAEVIELIIHTSTEKKITDGMEIKDLPLNPQITICNIIRGETVLFANPTMKLEEHDHVIIFVPNKKFIPEIEKLFQVNFYPV